MVAPVVHFEVIGKDVKKLSNFYSKLFEWERENRLKKINRPKDYQRYLNLVLEDSYPKIRQTDITDVLSLDKTIPDRFMSLIF